MASMVCFLMASEKASPLMETAFTPALAASSWKAAVLYQPAEAGLPFSEGRSKNTPTEGAPAPKVAEMREARP